MRDKSIFSAMLGLPAPWDITSISFSDDERRVDVAIEYNRNREHVCPVCGTEARVCTTAAEVWNCPDFINRYDAFFHVTAPIISCTGKCGMVKQDVPWPPERRSFNRLSSSVVPAEPAVDQAGY